MSILLDQLEIYRSPTLPEKSIALQAESREVE
jgi:hypothetical protein